MSVQEGDAAPDFEMPATGGRTVSLAALKGKPFILYFYPKADTPGCTKEACAFQEALPQLGKIGLDVIGEHLTEVNVTSPTCFREIQDQTGFDVSGMFLDALEVELKKPSR